MPVQAPFWTSAVHPGQLHEPLCVRQSEQDVGVAVPEQVPAPPESLPLLEPEPLPELAPELPELPELLPEGMHVPPAHAIPGLHAPPPQHAWPKSPQLPATPSWLPPSLPERLVPFALEHAPAMVPTRSKATIPARMRFI
jgi:hypothetical protein